MIGWPSIGSLLLRRWKIISTRTWRAGEFQKRMRASSRSMLGHGWSGRRACGRWITFLQPRKWQLGLFLAVLVVFSFFFEVLTEEGSRRSGVTRDGSRRAP